MSLGFSIVILFRTGEYYFNIEFILSAAHSLPR